MRTCEIYLLILFVSRKSFQCALQAYFEFNWPDFLVSTLDFNSCSTETLSTIGWNRVIFATIILCFLLFSRRTFGKGESWLRLKLAITSFFRYLSHWKRYGNSPIILKICFFIRANNKRQQFEVEVLERVTVVDIELLRSSSV